MTDEHPEPRVLAAAPRRRMLRLLVLNGCGQAAVAVVLTLCIRRGFDGLIADGARLPTAEIVALGVAMAVAAACGGWLRARERIDAERLGQHYVHAVRLVLYDRLVEVSPRRLQRRSHGAVLLRFVGDLSAIRIWVSLGLSRLIVSGTACAGAVAGLVVLDALLGLAVGLLLVAGAAVMFASGGELRDRTRSARRRRSRLAANVSEQVRSVGILHVFPRRADERRRLSRQSRLLSEAMVHRARAIGRLRGVTEGLAGIAPAVVLLVGAVEIAEGRAGPGTIAGAMMLAGLLTPMLRDLGRVPEYWYGAVVAREKIRTFLATPVLDRAPSGAPDLVVGGGELRFDGVSVTGALSGVTAVAPAGSVVAVVGPNGSGKSTLLALAAHLLDPDEGAVAIDGQDLREVSPTSVRRAIGLAGPDVPLLRGDIARNLRYRSPRAPGAELQRVRRLTGLDDVLDELPDAEATRLSEGGGGLSAGQRDRLALARAIVGDPALLLLDEVDAHLHREGAAAVQRVLADRRGRVTTIVVTHRPEIVEEADVVWRLEDGRLVAEARVRGLATASS